MDVPYKDFSISFSSSFIFSALGPLFSTKVNHGKFGQGDWELPLELCLFKAQRGLAPAVLNPHSERPREVIFLVRLTHIIFLLFLLIWVSSRRLKNLRPITFVQKDIS